MKVYDYLIDNYEVNKPIFLDELSIEGITYDNLRKQLSRLLEQNKIAKYSQGIYYIPKETVLGTSTLSFEEVITLKYVSNGRDVYGYYTGLTFVNKLGLSTQIPFTYEIVTNKEASRKRIVIINNRQTIVRRPYTTISKENVVEMQFLNLINSTYIEPINENYEMLKSYIKNNGLKKNIILELLKYFPAKASKRLIESKLLEEFV